MRLSNQWRLCLSKLYDIIKPPNSTTKSKLLVTGTATIEINLETHFLLFCDIYQSRKQLTEHENAREALIGHTITKNSLRFSWRTDKYSRNLIFVNVCWQNLLSWLEREMSFSHMKKLYDILCLFIK